MPVDLSFLTAAYITERPELLACAFRDATPEEREPVERDFNETMLARRVARATEEIDKLIRQTKNGLRTLETRRARLLTVTHQDLIGTWGVGEILDRVAEMIDTDDDDDDDDE